MCVCEHDWHAAVAVVVPVVAAPASIAVAYFRAFHAALFHCTEIAFRGSSCCSCCLDFVVVVAVVL